MWGWWDNLVHNQAQDHFWPLDLSSPSPQYGAETEDLLAKAYPAILLEQDGQEEESSIELWKTMGLGVRQTWLCVVVILLPSCVILGKFPKVPDYRDNNTHLTDSWGN